MTEARVGHPTPPGRHGRHAVVIGAGIAGLTAAQVLADHFEQVTVLERDRLPDTAADRAGTPQALHVHGLLAGGLNALTALFAGFEDELLSAGAVALRGGLDIRVERPGYDPFPMRDLGVLTYAVSRPAIELLLRRRLLQQAHVRLLAQCRVLEISSATRPGVDGAAAITVTGVRCQGGDQGIGPRGDQRGGVSTRLLPADLVVDASGRGVLTLALLRAAGYPAPAVTRIGVDIGYATATYEIPADDKRRGWLGVMTFPKAPQSSRGALMLPLEGGRWMLSLGGRGADKPAGDEAGFLEFARQLRTPTIYNAIRGARRVGDIARYVFPHSQRRHFERMPAFPRGLLPLGDAVCNFNPIYGQGMSVAAQEAVLLRRVLAHSSNATDPLAGLAAAFFSGLQPLLDTPWAMAAIPDFIFPDTTGERPPDLDRTLKFAFALLRLAARKPDVHKLVLEVQHLLKPRSAYRRPLLMARVLLELVRAGR